MSDLTRLPGSLPAPLDDGSCAHLPGLEVPPLPLPATDGSQVGLAALAGRVLFGTIMRSWKLRARGSSG